MNKTVIRIGVILLLIILLPAVFFSVKQLNSLNKNEKILEEIYQNQLDAILFSVNQYASDVINAWAAEVDRMLVTETPLPTEKLIRFFSNKPDLRYLFLIRTAHPDKVMLYDNSGGRAVNKALSASLLSELSQQRDEVHKLRDYLKNGYRKIAPLTDQPAPGATLIFLPLQNLPDELICGFVMNTEGFIYNELSPKIQAVTQEKFTISVQSEQEQERVYTTATTDERDSGISMHEAAFWLFPGYTMSIDLNGETIEALTQKRLRNDLLLIIVLNVVIFLGAWFVFRNIKKEIELAQIKSDFVANVSHEIRTPLSLISMFAETLKLGRVNSEERKQEYYQIISQETSRLSTMVNRILNFSKMEAGKYTYSMKLTNLNEVVRKIVEAYDFHIRQQGFTYECYLDEQKMYISADETALAEAFINLLDNAIKYSGRHKLISIRTGERRGYYFVEVEDQGVGISEHEQKAIFDKFYRVTEGDVHDTKGTGLGLSLVRHIMDAHGGSIDIRSRPREGSCFALSFPKISQESTIPEHI
jgi:two-component system phosphate regulon sensor histidine kinase PhoR